jgi:hypothetical protein
MNSPIEFAVFGFPTFSAVAERLCGTEIVDIRPCSGGGNNRVFRVMTADRTYAMKCYGPAELGEHDRLGHEFDGLRFLYEWGIRDILPRAVAVDRIARCALYEWVHGGPVGPRGVAELDALLDLLTALHAARRSPQAASLPLATEAVLQRSELLEQIDARIARLASVAQAEPQLASFVRRELQPELERQVARSRASGLDTRVPADARTLSPSDVGFHNAVRRPDGSLTFIDFEYFGWDDPVKVAADVLWHPAMQLNWGERRRLLAGAAALYGDDPMFVHRLANLYPLFGIRWVLIVLNEFIPAMWQRRSAAGHTGDWEHAKQTQLSKARSKLSLVRACAESEFIS